MLHRSGPPQTFANIAPSIQCVNIQFSPKPLECSPKYNTGIKCHINHDKE